MLFHFKTSSFTSNKVNGMENFHNTSFRSFLHANQHKENSILYLDLACTNIATIVISRFVKFWI